MSSNRLLLQKIILALSIVIVLNLLFNYAILTLYPSPQVDDFCTEETRKFYDDQGSCEAIGGEWVARGGFPVRAVASPGEKITADENEYCDATATCREQYSDARSIYNRNVFIALVVLGTASLVAGFFLVAVSAISFGFLFGGLLSIFIGTVRYWSDMDEYLRIIILAVVLAVLIWLGYRKLKDKDK